MFIGKPVVGVGCKSSIFCADCGVAISEFEYDDWEGDDEEEYDEATVADGMVVVVNVVAFIDAQEAVVTRAISDVPLLLLIRVGVVETTDEDVVWLL